MKYPDDKSFTGVQTSGTTAVHVEDGVFIPWQPSTWTEPDDNFLSNLETIFQTTILDEIGNVISDAQKANGSLEHRGHVISLAMLCAVDTLSSYAFLDIEKEVCETCKRPDGVRGHYIKYVEDFFPDSYKPFSELIYKKYRNSTVHSWNVFEVGMLPGDEPIEMQGESLIFGLINFYKALQESVENFIETAKTNEEIQKSCLERYTRLRGSAKP